MELFVQHYGLIAVYLGMWMEGETVLVISGFLAHQKLFPFPVVYSVATLGAISVDHAIYLAGHILGSREAFRRRIEKSRSLAARLDRLGTSWLGFFSVRFIYGTRMPYLFLLGSGRLAYGRFLVREVPAVLLWCFVWLVFGHAIGHSLVLLVGQIHRHHRPWIVLMMAAAGLVVAAATVLRRRAGRRAADSRS